MKDFKNLHLNDAPLLICNVWDVPSLKMAQELNFHAAATSSSAIAAMLGYGDGEEMDFEELEYIVGRMAAVAQLPLSVDLEGGYSRDPKEIAGHIRRLASLGVVGVNLEDSVVEEDRQQLDAVAFASVLKAVRQDLEEEGVEVFFNVRTDAFLLGHANPLAETKQRIALYEEAGADGIFVPFVQAESDIQAVVQCTSLPINVLAMPGLPGFEALIKLGVRRISLGNTAFSFLQRQLKTVLSKVREADSCAPLFE